MSEETQGNVQPQSPQSTETQAEAKSEPSLPQWTCELAKLPGDEAPSLEEWTVGSTYLLNCQGDYSERLGGSAQIRFSEEKWDYSLRILEVRSSDHTSAQFVVTGYKPGQYKSNGFQITDGTNSVEVAPLNWTVQSVLQPNQQAKPYPPYGPFEMSLPLWFWLSWLGVALIVILIVFGRVKKHLDRKRLLEKLAAHTTALSPYNQFNKDLRMMMRRHHVAMGEGAYDQKMTRDYLDEIDKAFRLFLLREFKVPALEWSQRDILREIKKRHRKVYEESGQDIKRLLIELTKAKKDPERVSRVDCDQLMDMSRKAADRIQKLERRSA